MRSKVSVIPSRYKGKKQSRGFLKKYKNKIMFALVVSLIINFLFIFVHSPAPVYTWLGSDEYVAVSDSEFIVGGQGSLLGKYYLIDSTSASSGLDASNFEVYPAGFPFACTFATQEFGFILFHLAFFIINVLL